LAFNERQPIARQFVLAAFAALSARPNCLAVLH
jgi:hypothetical protein